MTPQFTPTPAPNGGSIILDACSQSELAKLTDSALARNSATADSIAARVPASSVAQYRARAYRWEIARRATL